MLRAAVSAFARLCSAPRGWALEAATRIRGRTRGVSSSRPLREWAPKSIAKSPIMALPAQPPDPAGART
eukprot:4289369-Pyramimonas_sp.AAC.1